MTDSRASLEHAASGTDVLRVSTFVRETLAAHAASNRLLDQALERAQRTALPVTSLELRALFDGPLLELTRDELGAALAESVRTQLEQLLEIVGQLEAARSAVPSSSAESTDSESKPTVELRVRPFPIVLLLGPDEAAAHRLRARLTSSTAVVGVEDPTLLVRELRLLEHLSRMLIVDMRTPHDLLDTICAEPRLVERATIVLWGARRGLERELRPQLPGALVVRCGPEAEAEDLASIVRLGPAR
jgi:hypothetical protein